MRPAAEGARVVKIRNMAGIFDYNPGTSDQRADIIMHAGDVISRNISQAGASLGQAIGEAADRHKALKAKKALAEIYAEQLGGDSKSVDKMKLPQLDAFLMTAPDAINQRRQGQQSKILGDALSNFAGATTPKANINLPPMGSTFAGMMGNPAGTIGKPTMPDRSAALASALAGALKGGATPDTVNTLDSLAKTLMSGGGASVDPSTGLLLWGDKPLPASTQKYLGGGQGTDRPTFNFTPGPGGTSFWNFGNRGGEVRPPTPTSRPESLGLGPYPADATPPEGARVVKMKDGTFYIVPGGGTQPAGTAVEAVDNALNGSGGHTGGHDSGTGKTAQGGYEIGSIYGGLKYLGGDPNDESNWEKTEE